MNKVIPEDWDKFDWESVEEERGKSRMFKVLHYISPHGLHLDIGTGRGDGTYLVSQMKRTIGIDFGRKSLKIAARKNRDLAQADACNLPFKTAAFDSITCLDVLEHIPEAEKAVSEMRRALKPEGRLIMQTPTTGLNQIKAIAIRLSSPFYIARAIIKRLLNHNTHKEHYPQPYEVVLPLEKIRAMLTVNQFAIDKEKIVSYWHPNPIIRLFSFSKLFICSPR